MFSTLLGALPRDPTRDDATDEDRIRGTIADLEGVGLELVSDGEPLDLTTQPDAATVVAGWRRANAVVAAAGGAATAKQVLPGPYSASRDMRIVPEAWAVALKDTIAALAAAGCSFVEIDEPDALAISVVPSERRRFVDAHRRMTDGIAGVHLSLTLTGGNLDAAGPSTFFDLPYASYAFDLIAGPDNWRLIAAAPGDRGVICGAMSAAPGGDLNREVLVRFDYDLDGIVQVSATDRRTNRAEGITITASRERLGEAEKAASKAKLGAVDRRLEREITALLRRAERAMTRLEAEGQSTLAEEVLALGGDLERARQRSDYDRARVLIAALSELLYGREE